LTFYELWWSTCDRSGPARGRFRSVLDPRWFYADPDPVKIAMRIRKRFRMWIRIHALLTIVNNIQKDLTDVLFLNYKDSIR
jgi:hypothetical protein